MARDIKLNLIMLISAIIFITLFPNNMAQDQPITTAPISVKPLWGPVAGNETQPCHFVEAGNGSQGMGLLHGRTKHSCSVQINASLGYYTRIEIPKSGVSNESFFLYVERLGELDVCINKYVIFNGNPNACSGILLHESLYLNLEGNVSIFVTEVSASEINHVCPESNSNILGVTGVDQTQYCKSVQGYTNHITCFFYSWFGDRCYIIFPSNCNATLGYREVAFQCYDHDLLQTKVSLITYTVGTPILFLDSNKIVKLKGQPFQGLSYIHGLDLNDNYLTELDKGVFIGLSMLSLLDIYCNQLAHLDDDSFEGLGMLHELHLQVNKLTTLPVGFSGNLNTLNILILSRNQLDYVSEGMFERLKDLNYLTLENNNLTSLPDQLFHELDKLNELSLSRNKLHSLHSGVFNKLTNVDHLYLNVNELVVLPNGVFNGLINLEYLTLRYNGLLSLRNDVFNDLINLEDLDLSNNKLGTLPNDVFNELTNLGYLYLSNNK